MNLRKPKTGAKTGARAAPSVPVMRRQAKRIATLESEVAALEKTLGDMAERFREKIEDYIVADRERGTFKTERDEARAALSEIADSSAEPHTVAKARQAIRDSCPPDTFTSTFDASTTAAADTPPSETTELGSADDSDETR